MNPQPDPLAPDVARLAFTKERGMRNAVARLRQAKALIQEARRKAMAVEQTLSDFMDGPSEGEEGETEVSSLVQDDLDDLSEKIHQPDDDETDRANLDNAEVLLDQCIEAFEIIGRRSMFPSERAAHPDHIPIY